MLSKRPGFRQQWRLGLVATALSFSIYGQSINLYNMEAIQKNLLQSEQQIISNSISEEAMFSLQVKLKKLQPIIESCITDSSKKLDRLDKIFKQSNSSPEVNAEIKNQHLLATERSQIIQKKISCSVLDYQADKVSALLLIKIKKQRSLKVFFKNPTDWQSINLKSLSQECSQIKQFFSSNQPSILLELLIIYTLSLLLIKGLRFIAIRSIHTKKTAFFKTVFTAFSPYFLGILTSYLCLYGFLFNNPLTESLLINLRTASVYVIFFIIVRIALQPTIKKKQIADKYYPQFNYFFLFSLTVLSTMLKNLHSAFSSIPETFLPVVVSPRYPLLLVTIEGYFYLINQSQGWSPTIRNRLINRFGSLMIIFLLKGITDYYFTNKLHLVALNILSENILLVFSNIIYLSFSLMIIELKHVKHKFSKKSLIRIKKTLYFFYLFMIGIGLLGFHRLSVFLEINIFASFLILKLYYDANELIKKIFMKLSDPTQPMAAKFHHLIGIKLEKNLTEIHILRLLAFRIPSTIYIVVWLTEIWGFSAFDAYSFFYPLATDGFQILGQTIVAWEIARASAVFCTIMILGRICATTILSKVLYYEDSHIKSVASTIILYITIILASFTGLAVAHVKLTNLAFILGALSFGLGFGLQKIAADFLGGLFVLFLKPIKIDDHVVIGGSEGYIKRIGTISTKMVTPSNTEISIPNYSIISGTIMNFGNYQSKIFRLKIEIYLETAANLEKACQLIKLVLKKNKNVLQKSPNEPEILFTLTSLVIWFYIDNIEKKDAVNSELSIAIVRAFKKNDIDLLKLQPKRPDNLGV